MWYCIIIRTCVCDRETNHFNSNFLPLSEFQAIYAYKGCAYKKKRMFDRT